LKHKINKERKAEKTRYEGTAHGGSNRFLGEGRAICFISMLFMKTRKYIFLVNSFSIPFSKRLANGKSFLSFHNEKGKIEIKITLFYYENINSDRTRHITERFQRRFYHICRKHRRSRGFQHQTQRRLQTGAALRDSSTRKRDNNNVWKISYETPHRRIEKRAVTMSNFEIENILKELSVKVVCVDQLPLRIKN